MGSEEKLMPCPFCGCDIHLDYDPKHGYFGPEGAHKRGCFIGAIDFRDFADEHHAITAWNTRHPTPAADEVEAVAMIIEDCLVRHGVNLADSEGTAEDARAAILAMAEDRKAWTEAVATIIARCEALEDEAADELVKAESEHAQGYWRGQKMAAKSIRRELHDLTRALRSGEREG